MARMSHIERQKCPDKGAQNELQSAVISRQTDILVGTEWPELGWLLRDSVGVRSTTAAHIHGRIPHSKPVE